MNTNNFKKVRVLAIAPNKEGFGFALMRDTDTLLDWGTRSAGKGDKNANTLAKVKDLIIRLQPDMLVIPDVWEKGSQRGERIKRLTRQAADYARQKKLKVKKTGQGLVNQFFFAGAKGTKYDRALKISNRFPDELEDLLPPKRLVGMDENHQMPVFDAVAIATAYLFLKWN